MKDLCNKLQVLAGKTVEATQTGEMASVLRLDILSISVTDPEPPRVDPNGGRLATNETGEVYVCDTFSNTKQLVEKVACSRKKTKIHNQRFT